MNVMAATPAFVFLMGRGSDGVAQWKTGERERERERGGGGGGGGGGERH